MKNTKLYVLVAGIVLVVVGVVYFALPKITTAPATPLEIATTTLKDPGDVTLEDLIASGRATLTVASSSKPSTPKPGPSLSYELKISSSLSPAAVTALKTQLATAKATLEKDPTEFDSWMRMGMLAKIAGDYPRAIELWSYAGYLVGGSPVPFANIADLYANYLKDYPKAEANYKKALANNPTDQSYYIALHNLYRYSYHPTATAAEDILKAGIKAAPDPLDVRLTLARYYVATGKTSQAQTEFAAALDLATRMSKTDIANQIKTEAGL